MKRGWIAAMLCLCVGSLAAAAEPTSAPAKKTDAPRQANDKTKKEDLAIHKIDEMIAKAEVDKKDAAWKTKLTLPEKTTFDPAHKYFAVMETTKGPIRIRFMPDVAPMHVTNFIYLSRLGFYDGLPFHRVIPGFMAQGGDPLGNGMGGPGYKFAGEFKDDVKHDRAGLLSMANAGPGTDGSQFFLTFVATPWLDGKHTLFGEIVSGMDTMKKLEAAGSQGGRTTEPLKIEKVTIEVE
jgi:peptidyl-prolyl cis-trans isomerase B (cyclophilin B)